jgi:N6-adenosine-specific RNA methylase IME4
MARYRTILADPPWPYGKASAHPKLKGYSSFEYKPLSMKDLAALPVKKFSADYLFLWTTAPFVEEGWKLAREWGFEPRTMMAWCKGEKAYGVGFWFRSGFELVILATKPGAKAFRTNERAVIHAKNRGHSRKPDHLYEVIEEHFPPRYLELFATHPRKDWTSLGDAIDGLDIREALRKTRA